MLKFHKAKRILFCFTALLLILSILLCSCTRDNEKTTTTSKPLMYKIDVNYYSRLQLFLHHGIGYDHEDTERFPNGLFFPYDDGMSYDIVTPRNLQISMKTAKYLPIEKPKLGLSEYISLLFFYHELDKDTYEFSKDDVYGEYHEYTVKYFYEHESQKLFCTYDGQWYLVEDNSLLVDDLIYLIPIYEYETIRSGFEYKDKDGSVYGDCFIYDRFFTRKSGMDPSIYSGFVNTNELESLDADKVLELAIAEAQARDKNVKKHSEIAYDPLKSYWCVELSGEKYYHLVFINEKGQTVKINLRNADESFHARY